MRYTKLVRGYLDFDVDMENVRDFWKTAETAMAEHARYRLLQTKYLSIWFTSHFDQGCPLLSTDVS